MSANLNVLIACPLEAHLAARVASLATVADVSYDPDLLPIARYPNDPFGTPRERTTAQIDRWNEMLARADVLFGYPDESAAGLRDSLERGTRIRFVQGTSAGMGAHIRRADVGPEILERVAFASAAGVHGGMLAEFAFYGLLTLRKDARRLATIRANRAWDHYTMGELEGSTLAIVGMGQIGVAMATRARAFGMHVIGVTRSGSPHPAVDETVSTADLVALAPRCDAMLVTLPITDLTGGLISAVVIAALPTHAVLINVGRGAVVDESALIDALRGGKIAGAVLDVFATEPLRAQSPLWDMANVIVSPHTAALSVRENERIVDLFCDNLERLVAERPLRNLVNLREFY